MKVVVTTPDGKTQSHSCDNVVVIGKELVLYKGDFVVKSFGDGEWTSFAKGKDGE